MARRGLEARRRLDVGPRRGVAALRRGLTCLLYYLSLSLYIYIYLYLYMYIYIYIYIHIELVLCSSYSYDDSSRGVAALRRGLGGSRLLELLAELRHLLLRTGTLWYTKLYSSYYTILYYTILYYTLLYSTLLYSTLLYYAMLYNTMGGVDYVARAALCISSGHVSLTVFYWIYQWNRNPRSKLEPQIASLDKYFI